MEKEISSITVALCDDLECTPDNFFEDEKIRTFEFTRFEVDNDNLTTATKTIIQRVKSISNENDFLNELLSNSHYLAVKDYIEKHSSSNNDQNPAWRVTEFLDRFCIKYAKLSKNNPQNTTIEAAKNRFIERVKNKFADAQGEIWICGYYLEDNVEEYRLTDCIKIRKPKPDDFTSVCFVPNNIDCIKPSAVVEFQIETHLLPECDYGMNMRRAKDMIIASLSLLNTCSARCLGLKMEDIPGIICSTNNNYPLFKRPFRQLDSNRFKKIYEVVKHLSEEPAKIGYDRYRILLESSGEEASERKITTLVNALEAIVLKENGELKFKFCQRISLLLTFLGFDGLETREMLKISYDIRSNYIHGSAIDGKQKKKISDRLHMTIHELMKRIAEITRIVLTLFLILNVGKEEFVTRIDDSVHCENIRKDLIDKIKPMKEDIRPSFDIE